MDTKNSTPQGDLILYRTDDGRAEITFRADGGNVWLTQNQIADLFDTSKQNVSLHVANVFKDGEQDENSVVKEYLTTAADGKRYKTKAYNLPMILAIGYRVRSPRGVQFRQWATRHLEEYLVKGFVMDDERLKNPKGWDHFDELLARIREIRASELRFYQKVRDLFKLSVDYRDDEAATQTFFAEVQNKLLYAVTGRTAAELAAERANSAVPNMNLTAWEGSRVRKKDVTVAKNYLSTDEIDTLNRLVVLFLDQAELRIKERKQLTMVYWRENVNRLLAFNDRPILHGSGSVSHDDMVKVVHGHYDIFDRQRRAAEAVAADAEDIEELKALEQRLENKMNRSNPEKNR